MANDPHRRFNPFVEADRQSITDRTNAGHSVFHVRTRILLDVEEISGEGEGEKWEWNNFYFSHPSLDHLTPVQFMARIDEFVSMYYEGQQENGVMNFYLGTMTVHGGVTKYDNTNIQNLPLQGETYKTRCKWCSLKL